MAEGGVLNMGHPNERSICKSWKNHKSGRLDVLGLAPRFVAEIGHA